MKKYALLLFGILVYVLVTVVDIFVVSLPLSMYVGALFVGALLILLFFLGRQKEAAHRASAVHHVRPMVFHIRREPMMGHFAK